MKYLLMKAQSEYKSGTMTDIILEEPAMEYKSTQGQSEYNPGMEYKSTRGQSEYNSGMKYTSTRGQSEYNSGMDYDENNNNVMVDQGM